MSLWLVVSPCHRLRAKSGCCPLSTAGPSPENIKFWKRNDNDNNKEEDKNQDKDKEKSNYLVVEPHIARSLVVALVEEAEGPDPVLQRYYCTVL